MSTTGATLELTLDELLALGDAIGFAITAGTIDEWADNRQDSPLGLHLGLALRKLSLQLQEADQVCRLTGPPTDETVGGTVQLPLRRRPNKVRKAGAAR